MTVPATDLDHRQQHAVVPRTDIAIVVFDLQEHVSIDCREPTLAEALDMYERWFRVTHVAISDLGTAYNTVETENL